MKTQLTPFMFLGHLKNTLPRLLSVHARSSIIRVNPHSVHLIRGKPVFSPNEGFALASLLLEADDSPMRRCIAAELGVGGENKQEQDTNGSEQLGGRERAEQ